MEEVGQLVRLAILAVPVAWLSWTVTKEEVFREAREFCERRSRECRGVLRRKFFFLFTCEYCFSHWVALAFQLAFDFRMAFADWRGAVVGFAALVWTANVYMSLYQRLRVDIRKERVVANRVERAPADGRKVETARRNK